MINTAKDRGRWALLEENTQLLQKNDRKIMREREGEEIIKADQRDASTE